MIKTASVTPVNHSHPYWKILLSYALVYLFVALSDAIMSYVAPVYIESKVNNRALMGLIISSSSVIGIICDFLFARIFKNRSHIFFIWTAIICAAFFPAAFLIFPPALLLFFVSMAVWGIYYELLVFSDFNFIKESLPRSAYPSGWGILSTFKAASYFLGPLLAVYLTTTDFKPAFLLAIGLTGVSALLLSGHTLRHRKRTHHQAENGGIAQVKIPASSWVSQGHIWFALIKKIWPVYIFILLIYLIDATFWTIGALISKQLLETSHIGGLFLPAYSLPSLFVGLIIGKIFPPTGKKRLAFITAGLAGLLLLLVGFVTEPVLLIAVVFIASTLLSITFPEISAVFEDYVSRLNEFGNDMIGLKSSAGSLAYIIGPVLAGTIAATTSNQMVFTIFGLLLFVYSIFALIITPKKIRLPQQELQEQSTNMAD